MGLVYSQLKWLANKMKVIAPIKAVLQVGRLDIFIEKEELENLLIKLQVGGYCNGDKFCLFDKHSNDLYYSILNSNLAYNDKFSNPRFTKKRLISDKLFFGAFGVEKVDSVDIDSSRDGSTYSHDLNMQGLLMSVGGAKYDLVIDGGLMEHVFDVKSVLLNMNDVCDVNGYMIHILPGNNTLDHGFYQFSPTLFRDYYLANKYELIDIKLLELRKNMYSEPGSAFDDRYDSYRYYDYSPRLMAKCSFGKLDNSIYFNLVCVKKVIQSVSGVNPHQYIFTRGAEYISPWVE